MILSPLSLVGAALVGCSGTPTETPAPAPAPTEPAPAPEPAPPSFTFDVPAGLSGPPAVPADNPMTADKVELGHKLFMDPRLSVDGSRSCYSCHVNERGNADGRKLALGPGDKPLTRNTPTIWNVGYYPELYWDGRADSLEAQGKGALKGGNMGLGDGLDAKAAEIGALPEYKDAFTAVFSLAEGAPVTVDHVVQALSAYERTLLCGDPADPRSEAAERGKTLFEGEAGCAACHAPPLYTDLAYHDLGINFDNKGKPRKDPDPGRGKPSGKPEDEGRFRTPSLRNVAKTAPYFHDGRAETLADAVAFMAKGGNAKAPTIDPMLKAVALTPEQQGDIVAFLESLSCSGSLAVVGDPKPVATE